MVDIEKYINRSFYNPFLDSVAFEIRFPSTIRVIKDFLEFQELINEDYPNFAEEHLFLDFTDRTKIPENLRKYEFSDTNKQNRVRISMNALTIITTNYKKFDSFSKQIYDVTDKFVNCFKIISCLRIGLRYFNIYSLNNDLINSLRESEKLFVPFINTELMPYNEIFSQNIEIRRNLVENNKITIRNKLNYNKEKNSFQHILDFDAYNQDKIQITDYEKKLLDLRKVEKTRFLLSVTEEFMSKMEFID